MKKVWMFIRLCAAYIVRQQVSLMDMLVIIGMIRLLDQHRYMDAAVLLVLSAVAATVLKGIAGRMAESEVVVKVDPSLNTAGFARRVQETLNGRG